jgi:hypothetical protein
VPFDAATDSAKSDRRNDQFLKALLATEGRFEDVARVELAAERLADEPMPGRSVLRYGDRVHGGPVRRRGFRRTAENEGAP